MNTFRYIAVMVCVFFMINLAGATPAQTEIGAPKRADIQAQIATLHVPFIQNRGQVDERVAFYASTFGGGTAFVTYDGAIVYALPNHTPDAAISGVALRETFTGGTVTTVTSGAAAATQVSTFIGNDPARWRSNLPTYTQVNMGEVYPGIGVTLRVVGNTVEKIFDVQPGASPDQICLRLEGAQGLSVNAAGELIARTAAGAVTLSKPVAYQEIDGHKQPVKAAYAATGEHYRFTVGAYDPDIPLIIDPLLASTFLGGSGEDSAVALALDTEGYIYITGYTYSTDFPTTTGAYDRTHNGSRDGFVAKLNSTMTTLVASTFFGGSDDDWGGALAFDNWPSVYVTGYTASSNFPSKAGDYDTSLSGTSDAFVINLNSNLSTLFSATYLGGNGPDYGMDVEVDSSGNIFVTGTTCSDDFPTTSGAYEDTLSGWPDGFTAKLNNALSSLLAGTYFGGSGTDNGKSLVVDSSGWVYVTGETSSSNFQPMCGPPTLICIGGYDLEHNGGLDCFVTKFDTTNLNVGDMIISTYLGGTDDDSCNDLVMDSGGNLYVAGSTASTAFPTTTGAYDRSNGGGRDGFVSKFSTPFLELLASTYFGGYFDDYGQALALDSSGAPYVVGKTYSIDFPTTVGAFDRIPFMGWNGFVSKFSGSLTGIIASTFLSGSGEDGVNGVTVDNSNNIYVTGRTASTDFPVTSNGYDCTYNGGDYDAFVLKLDAGLSGELNYLLWTK